MALCPQARLRGRRVLGEQRPLRPQGGSWAARGAGRTLRLRGQNMWRQLRASSAPRPPAQPETRTKNKRCFSGRGQRQAREDAPSAASSWVTQGVELTRAPGSLPEPWLRDLKCNRTGDSPGKEFPSPTQPQGTRTSGLSLQPAAGSWALQRPGLQPLPRVWGPEGQERTGSGLQPAPTHQAGQPLAHPPHCCHLGPHRRSPSWARLRFHSQLPAAKGCGLSGQTRVSRASQLVRPVTRVQNGDGQVAWGPNFLEPSAGSRVRRKTQVFSQECVGES